MGNKEHKKQQVQMSESYVIGILLALVGGFLDAYTYISREGVFANAQTGNIVLMGMNAARGQFRQAAYYLIPITFFVVGILMSEVVKDAFKEHPKIHWRQIIIAVEIVVLAIVAFVPEGKWDVLVILSISFVCSLQVESFRKMKGKPYATTMCTGNLRSATEMLFQYHRTKEKGLLHGSLQIYSIILFFIIGAAVGALVTNWLGAYAVLMACAGLSAVFVLMFQRPEE